MDRKLIEKYKNELMRTYRSSSNSKRTTAVMADVPQQGFYTPGTPYQGEDASDVNGRLTAAITAISSLYPVKGAKVTVFTGEYENPQIIDTDITNESGKTKVFSLAAPPRSLSMQAQETEVPYALYNMLVEAEGYSSNLHLNIPVFRGVTSLQSSNLIPLASAGNNGPIVYNEASRYRL